MSAGAFVWLLLYVLYRSVFIVLLIGLFDYYDLVQQATRICSVPVPPKATTAPPPPPKSFPKPATASLQPKHLNKAALNEALKFFDIKPYIIGLTQEFAYENKWKVVMTAFMWP